MKKSLLPFLSLFILLSAFTCENEPLEGFDDPAEVVAPLDCLSALQAYNAAILGYSTWDGVDNSEYSILCNAYASSLQGMIDNCGDPTGSFQALLTTLGDCSEPLDPDTCEGITAAVAVAENNLNNAPNDQYTQFCSVYVMALESQIEVCGDADGSIQAIINSLGDCTQNEALLLKKIIFTQNTNNNIEFFYDNDNQLIKIEGVDGSSKRWTYVDGKVEKAQFYDSMGNLTGDSEERYIYVNGIMTERRDSYNVSSTPVLDEMYEYEFNSDGKLIESRYFGTNETEFSIKYIFTYNSDGNLTNRTIDYTNPAQTDTSNDITSYDDKNYFMKNIDPRIVLIDDFPNDSENNPNEGAVYEYNSQDYPISKSIGGNVVEEYEYY